MSTIERIGVIGGGLMGSGITEVSARAGLDVVLVEISSDAAKAAAERVETSLRRAEQRGKIGASEVDAVLARITYADDLEMLADRDLVVEAASEVEKTKLELFRRVGRILTKDDAILASNTSSIPIVKLGAVSGRPHHVMGVHFFNPAPVMQLVELIPSLTTSPETLDRMRSWVTDSLGKKPIGATDRAGFVVNSLLVPYLLSAIRMYEAGYASATDIDRGMVLGCGHPMGPLALSDLIGLDTVRAIGVSMYEEFKEPLYSPPPLLDRMVDAGLLGKKSGQGSTHTSDLSAPEEGLGRDIAQRSVSPSWVAAATLPDASTSGTNTWSRWVTTCLRLADIHSDVARCRLSMMPRP